MKRDPTLAASRGPQNATLRTGVEIQIRGEGGAPILVKMHKDRLAQKGETDETHADGSQDSR
jgi:hypothetical protein